MAQFARPDSDITVLTFNGGFADMDEASASDADFSWATPGNNSELEVGLTNVTDPQGNTGHIFRYRIAKVTSAGVVDGAGNAPLVTVRLMQNGTQIATDVQRTATGTWTSYSYTLSASEADAITDYTNLRLEFICSNSGGNPSSRRGGAISWAELEVPDAPSGQQYNQPVSGSLSFTGAVIKRAGRALSASLGFTGAVVRRTSRSITATLGLGGQITKSTTRSVTAGLDLEGSVLKFTSHSTAGALDFGTSFSAQLVAPETPALIAVHIHPE